MNINIRVASASLSIPSIQDLMRAQAVAVYLVVPFEYADGQMSFSKLELLELVDSSLVTLRTNEHKMRICRSICTDRNYLRHQQPNLSLADLSAPCEHCFY